MTDPVARASKEHTDARLPTKSRWLGIFPRRNLHHGGQTTYPLGVAVFRPWGWPPFFSMTSFTPRILIRLRNGGAAISGSSVTLLLAEYDAPLPLIRDELMNWREVGSLVDLDTWSAGVVKQVRFKLRRTIIATPGTYVMGFEIQRVDPRPDGYGSMEAIGKYFIGEYFRVEPVSSVLTFQLVVGTALTAVATVALAIVTLVLHGG